MEPAQRKQLTQLCVRVSGHAACQARAGAEAGGTGDTRAAAAATAARTCIAWACRLTCLLAAQDGAAPAGHAGVPTPVLASLLCAYRGMPARPENLACDQVGASRRTLLP